MPPVTSCAEGELNGAQGVHSVPSGIPMAPTGIQGDPSGAQWDSRGGQWDPTCAERDRRTARLEGKGQGSGRPPDFWRPPDFQGFPSGTRRGRFRAPTPPGAPPGGPGARKAWNPLKYAKTAEFH